MVAVGKSIEVKKMSREDPEYSAYVDEIQQQVADEIQRVYYKYRCVYGWDNRPLELYSRVCYKQTLMVHLSIAILQLRPPARSKLLSPPTATGGT